jgi:hypothetical protein
MYRYAYLKLAKCHAFLIIFCVFSSTKSENKRAEPVQEVGGGAWGDPNNVHTSKYMQDDKKRVCFLKR